MLYRLTDGGTKHVQDNLANDEEKCTKDQISQWPSILQCVDHQQHLHAEVYKQWNCGNDIQDDEHSNRICRT